MKRLEPKPILKEEGNNAGGQLRGRELVSRETNTFFMNPNK